MHLFLNDKKGHESTQFSPSQNIISYPGCKNHLSSHTVLDSVLRTKSVFIWHIDFCPLCYGSLHRSDTDVKSYIDTKDTTLVSKSLISRPTL